LAGAGRATIADHQLMIAARAHVEVDDQGIPTGALPAVAGTPLDFTTPRPLGPALAEVAGRGGFDSCLVLDPAGDQCPSPRLAARVIEPASGRIMEIYSDQPGVQLYTANHLSGHPAEGGFGRHSALCLEMQHFPDSPNHSHFPDTILRPGQTYRQRTVHRFSVAPA
ncbi:MAG: galactose-1-epimerase, partial [Myxococcota bacterium]